MPRTPGWIKRADRQAIYVSASVRLSDGRKISVVLTDASSDGCKVSCRQVLPIGEIVELAVPGRATIHASVRWWTPGNAGLQFIAVRAVGGPDHRRSRHDAHGSRGRRTLEELP